MQVENSREAAVKGDLAELRTDLKRGIASIEQKLHDKIDAVEQKLHGRTEAVEQKLYRRTESLETALKNEISAVSSALGRLAAELAKTQADIREIKHEITAKLSTKDDINRILNTLDKFSARVENYIRKDLSSHT